MNGHAGAPAPPERASFTLQELGRIALLPFRGPGLRSKWLFGIAAVLVPFVGWFLLGGYQVRVARRALESEPETLPVWDDFLGLALDCARLGVVMLAFLLPASLLLGWTVGLWVAPETPGDMAISAVILGLSGLLTVLATQQIAAGRFGAAFNIVGHARRVRRHPFLCLIIVAAEIALTYPIDTMDTDLELLLIDWLTFIVTAPFTFWVASVTGALIGTAGRKMGVALEPTNLDAELTLRREVDPVTEARTEE